MRLACWRRCVTVANFLRVNFSLGALSQKFVALEQRDQHTGRVRYPDEETKRDEAVFAAR